MVNPNRSGRLNSNVRRRAQQGIFILVLQILHDAWPSTVADSLVSRDAEEDTISNVLRWKMEDAKNRLDPAPQLLFVRESQSDDPEFENPIGLIDIQVFYGWDAQTYLTMECKRISSTENSLAIKYVRNGVNRFVSGKYGPGHAFGMILGYSVCGNPKGCADRVCTTLASEPEAETRYDFTFGWKADSSLIKGHQHYRTRHHQLIADNKIELIHAFLPLL